MRQVAGGRRDGGGDDGRTPAGPVAAQDPDVLLLEADSEQEQALDLVRQLRRHRFGPDPAIHVFTLRSTVTAAELQRHAASGVDTVLDKPLSRKVVTDHVASCGQHPRLMVVSPGYVGPERRAVPRPDVRSDVVEVPNRVQAVLEGHRLPPQALQRGLQPLLQRLAAQAAAARG